MSVFYDYLLDLPAAESTLAEYLSDADERGRILQLLDASLHHVALDTIFRVLPADAHEVFLVQFHAKPNDEHHWVFLRRFAPNIEDLIRDNAMTSQKQFLDAIHV